MARHTLRTSTFQQTLEVSGAATSITALPAHANTAATHHAHGSATHETHPIYLTTNQLDLSTHNSTPPTPLQYHRTPACTLR